MRSSLLRLRQAALCLMLAQALLACGGEGNPGERAGNGNTPRTAPVDVAPTSRPVTPPGPPVTRPDSAVQIAGVELAQSLLYSSSDPALVLVAGKDVLVKVNVTATDTHAITPEGVLRIGAADDAHLLEIALTKPTGSVPAVVSAVPSFGDSYSAVVPAALVRSGLRLNINIAQGGSTVSLAPRVGGGVGLRIVAVPVQIETTNGEVVANMANYLAARLPVASVDVRTRAVHRSTSVEKLPALTDFSWNGVFSSILEEMDRLYLTETAGAPGTDHILYYAFIPKRNFGTTGLGRVTGNIAVVADLPAYPDIVRQTVLHEIGHNLGLLHAPCGILSGRVDGQYPYLNATLGQGNRMIWGYNSVSRTFIDPRNTQLRDAMAYCNGNTFSDYNYRNMQIFLTPADEYTTGSAAEVAGPQELLMVTGRVTGDLVELRPLHSQHGFARLPRTGRYTLRLSTASGVAEHPFALLETDHDSSAKSFAFTVPNPGSLLGINILKDGISIYQRSSPALPSANLRANRNANLSANVPASANAASAPEPSIRQISTWPLTFSEQGQRLRVLWDAQAYPYLTVIHVAAANVADGIAVQAERSSMAQDTGGGSADIDVQHLKAGGSFEFILSDGMNSTRITRQR